jgi:hypothetical protein
MEYFPEKLRVTEMVKKYLCLLGKLKVYCCLHKSHTPPHPISKPPKGIMQEVAVA